MPAGKGKGGGYRRLSTDLGAELIERGAPIHAHGRNDWAPEFIRCERASARNEQQQRQLKSHDEPASPRSHCDAPRRLLLVVRF
jgi:hypothetical protein